MKQLKTFWDGLDPRRRLIAALGVLAVLVAVFGLIRAATEPSMALLYSGLDATAAGEVVAALEAESVPFEVADGAILVEASARDRIRMELAGRGLPAGGPAGYEILDGLTGFGTTSQMFDAAYWRAKEGELARTITGSTNVRAARVHLANPVSQPFSRSPAGSASVTVTMARGELDRGQAEAIRYLVSSAVAGIAPDAVAVIDSAKGIVLAGEEDPLKGPGGATDREATLKANIERLLEARVGPGRAIVEVNVDTAMESETVSERTIDPDSRVAISSEVEESSESASGTNPGVTVASNLPDGDVSGDAGNNSRTATESRERQNFEVSETRREKDHRPGPGPPHQRRGHGRRRRRHRSPRAVATWAPRPEPELEMLRQLVQSAIGFDAERGDVVTIQSLQFTAVPEAGALVEAGSGFLAANGARLIQLGVLAAVVLALIVFVLRPLAARRPMLEITELTGPRETPAGQPRLDAPARRRHPRPAGADRHQDRAPARRHLQPHRRLGRGAQELDRVPRNPQGARRIMNAYRLESFSPAIAQRSDPEHDRAPHRHRARGVLPPRLPRRPGGGQRGLPRRPGPADQRPRRGDRRRPADQRGRAPPRRRLDRPDDRGARRRHRPGARRGRPRRRGRPDRRARPGAGARRAAAAALRPGGRRPASSDAARRRAGSTPPSRRRPELLPREALVFWDQGYDHLDLDGCVAQVRACIASHLARNGTGEDDDPRHFG